MAECQRPHMAANDVLHFPVDLKMPLGVAAGRIRMRKAMQRALLLLMMMPVIQIKVVQQRTHCQITIIHTQVQP